MPNRECRPTGAGVYVVDERQAEPDREHLAFPARELDSRGTLDTLQDAVLGGDASPFGLGNAVLVCRSWHAATFTHVELNGT